MIQVKQVIGGGRNVTLHITGMLTEGDLELTPIDLDPEKNLRSDKSRAKLSSLVWVVQEKLTLYLLWNKNPDSLIMPMESRNSVRLDSSMAPPDHWIGTLWLGSSNWQPQGRAFFIALDFDL